MHGWELSSVFHNFILLLFFIISGFAEFQAQKRIKIAARPVLEGAGASSERSQRLASLLQKRHQSGLSHRSFQPPKPSSSCVDTQTLVQRTPLKRCGDSSQVEGEPDENTPGGRLSTEEKSSDDDRSHGASLADEEREASCSSSVNDRSCANQSSLSLLADYAESDGSASDDTG